MSQTTETTRWITTAIITLIVAIGLALSSGGQTDSSPNSFDTTPTGTQVHLSLSD